MNFKVLLAIGFVLSLSGCDKKLTYCQFDDTLVRSTTDKTYSIMLGRKGIYVLGGKYEIYGHVGKPGQLLGYAGICEFKLEDLLAKYPQFRTPEIDKLAKAQAKRLKNVPQVPAASKLEMAPVPAQDENQSGAGQRVGRPIQLDQQPSAKISS